MEEKNKSFDIKKGEYKGTITIQHSGTYELNNSIFWAYNESAIKITAPNVILKNARVEVIGKNGYAIETDFSDLMLENVEVKGKIKGLPSESENWNLPSLISLGEFASETENTFFKSLEVPENCNIINNIYGVTIYPMNLKKGSNQIKITISPMHSNNIICGEIFIQSKVKRRIYINGKAVKNAPKKDNVYFLKKGQRIIIDENFNGDFKFVFESKSIKENMDIDAYVFLTDENKTVYNEDDFIFFSNPCSKDNSVKIGGNSKNPEVSVILSKLDKKYSRISICFAIYGDNKNLNFLLAESPVIHIFSNQNEISQFPLENLHDEKAVVAFEIYKYKNQWRMNCIGSGYRDGLKKLCQSFGLELTE